MGDARRLAAHRAIVVATRGGMPGLCPNNADSFLKPFGPPVLQVAQEALPLLQQGGDVTVVAQAITSPVTAFNVTAKIAGRSKELPPLVVMTPRSGWWGCASERGGGIACWLEVMRAMRATAPARDILFVASSGHELGHLGINNFVERRAGIVEHSRAWMHFGANIGAAQNAGNSVQASDDEMETTLADALLRDGLKVDRRVPRGTVPNGEAEVVHRGGGRYLSVIGGNALFHNPADRGPEAVDIAAIARFAGAFTGIAGGLAL